MNSRVEAENNVTVSIKFSDSAIAIYISGTSRPITVFGNVAEDDPVDLENEKKIQLKVYMRRCTISGLLCSLSLPDSGIISSAFVSSMLGDLGRDQDLRYPVFILIFIVASVRFQLSATTAVQLLEP